MSLKGTGFYLNLLGKKLEPSLGFKNNKKLTPDTIGAFEKAEEIWFCVTGEPSVVFKEEMFLFALSLRTDVSMGSSAGLILPSLYLREATFSSPINMALSVF